MIWDFLYGAFSNDADASPPVGDSSLTSINPATGLPMLDDSACGVDVGGSPYGIDIHGSLGSGFGSIPWE